MHINFFEGASALLGLGSGMFALLSPGLRSTRSARRVGLLLSAEMGGAERNLEVEVTTFEVSL